MSEVNLYLFLFLCSVSAQLGIIYFFKKRNIFQRIYNLSPQTHQKKSLTPSMGGMGILITLGVSYFLFDHSVEIKWLFLIIGLFALIGFVDDFLSLAFGKNQGLKTVQKFMLQLFISLFVLWVYHINIGPLSFWQFFLYSFCLVGMSNSTNLTDGLDGLLAGSSILTLSGFLCFILINQVSFELHIIWSLMIGVVGFFLFNKYPARIFMGDTGSLFLGAFFCGLAICLNYIWLIIPFCALYILESLSVMIQVFYFKLTRKRIFLMSPIHHHFELLGIKENNVVYFFWCIQLTFVSFSMIYLI